MLETLIQSFFKRKGDKLEKEIQRAISEYHSPPPPFLALEERPPIKGEEENSQISGGNLLLKQVQNMKLRTLPLTVIILRRKPKQNYKFKQNFNYKRSKLKALILWDK